MKTATKKQTLQNELAGALERINATLKANGYKLEIGHRNDYTAIDLMNLNGNMITYITAGETDRSALNYIYAMLKGIDLISNPYTK